MKEVPDHNKAKDLRLSVFLKSLQWLVSFQSGPQNGGPVAIFSYDGPHFGVQILDPKSAKQGSLRSLLPLLLSSAYFCRRLSAVSSPAVSLAQQAQVPLPCGSSPNGAQLDGFLGASVLSKIYSCQQVSGASLHAWPCLCPFYLVVRLIAAARFALLRTGEAPLSAIGFCVDFLPPFWCHLKCQFCCKAAGGA